MLHRDLQQGVNDKWQGRVQSCHCKADVLTQEGFDSKTRTSRSA